MKVHAPIPFPRKTLENLQGYREEALQKPLEEMASLDFSDFDAQAIRSANNSKLLVACSALVYENEADQRAFLAHQGAVKDFHFLDSEHNARLGIEAPDTGTQLSVTELEEAVLVSARGTVLCSEGAGFWDRDWQDVLNNLSCWPTRNYADNAWVHAGFKRATDGIWEQLKPHLESAAALNKKIHFTGHSLGAAIALHLADRTWRELQQRPGSVVTIGGPAAGWGGHRKHFEESGLSARVTRFVDSFDPIVPAVLLGQHPGAEGYFNHRNELEWSLGGCHFLDRTRVALRDLGTLNYPMQHHHPVNYFELVSAQADKVPTITDCILMPGVPDEPGPPSPARLKRGQTS